MLPSSARYREYWKFVKNRRRSEQSLFHRDPSSNKIRYVAAGGSSLTPALENVNGLAHQKKSISSLLNEIIGQGPRCHVNPPSNSRPRQTNYVPANCSSSLTPANLICRKVTDRFEVHFQKQLPLELDDNDLSSTRTCLSPST